MSLSNIEVWESTKELSKRYPYRPSEKIRLEDLVGVNFEKYKRFKPEVLVENVDCLDYARQMFLFHLNPAILNMADDNTPGGEVALGSDGREESIFRRTNINRTLNLETGFYPLRGAELVYSPRVFIFKNEWNNLIMSDTLDIISCPGLRMLEGGELKPEDRQLLEARIELIFKVAALKGCDSVVLGEMGCGAGEVAKCFKKVMGEFGSMFKKIVFAIYNKDGIAETDNLEVFRRVLLER